MITHADKLIVLEHFERDHRLPKYRVKSNVKSKTMSKSKFYDGSEDSEDSEDSDGPSTFRMSTGAFTVTNDQHVALETAMTHMINMSNESKKPLTRWGRFKVWLTRITSSPKKEVPVPTPVHMMSVDEFFTNVKSSTVGIKLSKERSKGYEQAIIGAKKAGQEALLEQLMNGLNAYKMEGHCLELGLNKVVSEETIVKFYKQVKKGLRLDYVKNFVRQIPQSILDVKVKADEFGIFDNYVVLHYDPDARSYAESETEKAAKRDPILFGLIQGKRQLYFIGDWIDELCDLTLDQLADHMGKEAIQELT